MATLKPLICVARKKQQENIIFRLSDNYKKMYVTIWHGKLNGLISGCFLLSQWEQFHISMPNQTAQERAFRKKPVLFTIQFLVVSCVEI